MGRKRSGPYRKKGRSYFQATVGGALRRYDVETLKDARIAWKQDVAAVARRRPLPVHVDGFSFESIAAAFLDHVKATGKAKATYRTHRQRLKVFVDHVGREIAADDVAPNDLTTMFRKRDLGPTTQARIVETVKAALNWAVREGHLKANPVAHYRKPASKRREFLWERSQAAAIVRALPRYLARWTLFLWHTGCRPDEATRALGSHVGRNGATIEVRKSKTGKPRTVVVEGRLRRRLARWARKAGSGPLFEAPEGGPVTDSQRGKPWRKARVAAKLPTAAVPYSFRHSWIHRSLTEGRLSIVEIAQLTDTSITMLQKCYGHLERAPLDRLAERLSRS